jgi:hypothetical protein
MLVRRTPDGEQRQHLGAPQLAPEHRPSGGIDTVDLKDGFGEFKPNHRDRHVPPSFVEAAHLIFLSSGSWGKRGRPSQHDRKTNLTILNSLATHGRSIHQGQTFPL